MLDRLFLSSALSEILNTHKVIEYKEDYGMRESEEAFKNKVNADINNLEKGISFEREELFRSILIDIALVCEERGLDFVLLDGPYNIDVFSEDLLNSENGTLVNYKRILNEVSDKMDIAYLDYIWELGLRDDQYMDIVHLTDYEARKSYTDGLIENLADVIK